jgi:hypothetical protein
MMKSQLLDEYRPHCYTAEFHQAWSDWENHLPLKTFADPKAQTSYDNGLEAAMRWQRTSGVKVTYTQTSTRNKRSSY